MLQCLDLPGSRQGQVTGSCENCNELLSSIKLRQLMNTWALISLWRGTLLHRVAFSPEFGEHWCDLCVTHRTEVYSAATKSCKHHARTLAVRLPTDLSRSVYPSIARHIMLVVQSTQLAKRWARGLDYSLLFLHSEFCPVSRQRRILNWQQRLRYRPD